MQGTDLENRVSVEGIIRISSSNWTSYYSLFNKACVQFGFDLAKWAGPNEPTALTHLLERFD